jgi:hypothetical protein
VADDEVLVEEDYGNRQIVEYLTALFVDSMPGRGGDAAGRN